MTVFAMDLGATNLRVCAADGDALLFARRLRTPGPADLPPLLRGLAVAGCRSVGLSRAAGLGPDGRVTSWPSRPDWVGVPLLAMVEDVLRSPSHHADDGVCAALFEDARRTGRAAEPARVLSLAIGTGLGIAVVADGVPVAWGDGDGGPAHRPYPGGRRPCRCGRRGCLQTALAADALARLAAEGAMDEIAAALAAAVALADGGDGGVRVVVSGGGCEGPGRAVIAAALTRLGVEWEFSPVPHLSGVLGAALLASRAAGPDRARLATAWLAESR